MYGLPSSGVSLSLTVGSKQKMYSISCQTCSMGIGPNAPLKRPNFFFCIGTNGTRWNSGMEQNFSPAYLFGFVQCPMPFVLFGSVIDFDSMRYRCRTVYWYSWSSRSIPLFHYSTTIPQLHIPLLHHSWFFLCRANCERLSKAWYHALVGLHTISSK